MKISTFSMMSIVIVAISITSVASLATYRNISYDTFHTTNSQHNTQVEPGSYAYNSTVVAATQTGSSIITNQAGNSFPFRGCLPGITVAMNGIYDRVSDPTVGYDAKHKIWMIAGLAFSPSAGTSAISVSRSTNGGTTWLNPVYASIAVGSQSYDKDWIICDNWPRSPYYGNCYLQWDDNGNNNLAYMATSTDGGLTWKVSTTAGSDSCIGGQPLVQPSGTVVVPSSSGAMERIISWRSTDGGTTWQAAVTVASVVVFTDPGGIRSSSLPSASMDGSGRVIVTWQDCRFSAGCTANDIVYSSSLDGLVWSPVVRIPIDPVSTVDHFIPGFVIDTKTSGATTAMALTYYYYPDPSCGGGSTTTTTTTPCKLYVGFVSSINNGSTWRKQTLAGPMDLGWLAKTTGGLMVGDYISTTILGGKAIPIFSVAVAGTTAGGFSQSMATSLAPIPLYTTTTAVSTSSPTFKPTISPSRNPSVTKTPTRIPTTGQPTATPTAVLPTGAPSWQPTAAPTRSPTATVQNSPTRVPSIRPTFSRSSIPSGKPTMSPTKPTMSPTKPTMSPTSIPSVKPTKSPTNIPSARPIFSTTSKPSVKSTTIPTS